MEKRYCVLVACMMAFLCLLFACQKDDGVMGGEDTRLPIDLSGEIDQVMLSRVNDGGFCDKDVIGVYIVDYEGGKPGELKLEGNRASNVQFTYNEANNKWSGAYDIYWKDSKTPIDVYGYYPWNSQESIGEYAFEVQKDQSKAGENGNLGGYEASDFLWGKAEEVAPSTKVIRLAFRHKMSTARVTLVEGEGFAEGEWTGLEKQVLVTNTKRKALIDLKTGNVTATGTVAITGTIPYQKDGEFRAIVVPQEISTGTELFKITVDGVVYTFKKNEAFTYVSSKMQNFTIKVNKKENTGAYEFVLVSESITAWENDIITHDATAKEYIVIESEAGKLKEAIKAANKDFRQLQNLKITGEICALDFHFMRDSMDRLQALNLKEVKIVRYYDEWGNLVPENDKIPEGAFNKKKSLQRIILPDKLKIIGTFAFYNCTNLTGSLTIPEGVVKIEAAAFQSCVNLKGTLSLPTTLEYLGDENSVGSVFDECGFTCELKLPDKLKYIGNYTFNNCQNLYGSLILPENLEYIGLGAFQNCRGFTGSLEIPKRVSVIHQEAFNYCGFDGILKLHDGIINIEENAFRCRFKGELVLPKNLFVLSNGVFAGCNFSGELKLPEKLSSIGDFAFGDNQRLTGVLEIPQSVQNIGEGAFIGCSMIEKLILSDNLESIGSVAFGNCFYINSIVCKSITPSYMHMNAFDGVEKENVVLEIPEIAIQQYNSAPGWCEFKKITAHRKLVCRPSELKTLNGRTERQLVLDAEGKWEVVSKPDWCTLSTMSGEKKTELTLTIDAGSESREGEIVFKLDEYDYTTTCRVAQYYYEHEEDEEITLQTHSRGKGINLVFLGDGFDAENISNGDYLRVMNEQMERFFDIEPYHTYRDYFNVSTAIAVSPESGIGTVNTIRNTKFETTFTGEVGLRGNYSTIFNYAMEVSPVDESNLNQSLIIVTPNTIDYGGITEMWTDGSAIAFCPLSEDSYPYDARGIIQHEAGGHGFGKLGDEYIYHNTFIDFCDCTCCEHVFEFNIAKSLGWYENLSLTGKMHEVPWSHLIFDDRYSDVVDIYEGGFMHARGVFRSEQNSCMNNNISYYNAISREAIVKRIMEYAGESYSFEKFVENDKRDAVNSLSRSAERPGVTVRGNQYAPRIHKGKPDILK